MRKIKSNIHIFECKKEKKRKLSFESLLTSCFLCLIDQFDGTTERLQIGNHILFHISQYIEHKIYYLIFLLHIEF